MTNVNERQYQLPFCQVLAAQGETILYVSTHGQLEKGKDVITRTATGQIRAYQLKAGDIAVSGWRDIYGEIVNLVELAIELPGTSPVIDFVPYLVTNGTMTDAALEQVRVANVSWNARGIRKNLQVVQKGELFERFRASHGAYLPRELSDFRTFLELILHDGSAPAEKRKAAQLFEHLLPSEPQNENGLNVARAASSLVLLAAYMTGAAEAALNHWCVFEYWVLAAAYILYLIEKSGKAEAQCRVSFDICEAAAKGAISALVDECAQQTNFIQGFPLVEGHTYRQRITILSGLFSSWDLHQRIKMKARSDNDFIEGFLDTRLKEAAVWGESAIPYLFLVALEMEQRCRQNIAEGIAIQLIRDITNANGSSAIGRGIPSPYYSAEEALRFNDFLDPLNPEQFLGFSYCVQSLIDFLARRWRRQALARAWYGLTRMALAEYVPANGSEWFRWNSSNGVLNSQLPNEPQSWEALRIDAENRSVDALPRTLRERPAFALWFILVYPHRFTPSMAKLVEDSLRGS